MSLKETYELVKRVYTIDVIRNALFPDVKTLGDIFDMPPVSKAQARFMFANRKKKGKIGKVAREFTNDLKPGSIKKLPARKKK